MSAVTSNNPTNRKHILSFNGPGCVKQSHLAAGQQQQP